MGSDLDYQREIFANRLKKRSKHLRKWASRNGITCYRLYDRDIPEVPLVVDRYGSYLHIAEYHSPHKELPGPPEVYAERMRETAYRALGVPQERAFYKTRRRTSRDEQYEKLAERHVTAIVEEGGLRFQVNLSDYLDTGLFLDHRISRAMVREIVAEMRESGTVRVLNLFGYTGSFCVYAAAGGATETINVDLSNTYSRWAATNLELNGFPRDNHVQVTEDVFEFLDREQRRSARYDVIVLDPPTFSNSKKMNRVLDVQRDHGELLTACGRILTRTGVVFFSTNKRDFTLRDVPEGLTIADVTSQTIPEDFRNRRIHRAYVAERSAS